MVPEGAVGPLFKVINERMQASADADLKEQGLTFAQSQVIVYLIEHAGQALQKEIETSLKVSHPTVSGLVSRLEKNGFVRTWAAEDDRRNKVVELTDKAHDAGDRMRATMRERDRELLAGLDEREQTELIRMLRRVYANVCKQ